MARRVEVYGLLPSVEFAKAAYYARQLPESVGVVVEGMVETDWQSYVQQLRLKGDLLPGSAKVAARVDGELSGSEEQLAGMVMETLGRAVSVTDEEARRLGAEEYARLLNASRCKYVRWQVTIGDSPARPVVLQLADSMCPKTVAAFWQLACGNGFLHYRGSLFHRVVADGFVEGGLLKTSSGQPANCTHSGETMLDENYAYRHDRPGVVGLSRSVPSRNGSAFYITLRAMPSLDTKNVAFGRVIEGMDVIRDISRVANKNQRPLVPCKVVRSGPHLEADGRTARDDVSPRKGEHVRTQSKLEAADIDTLIQRRDAIVKDIEKTTEELSEQEAVLSLVSEILRHRQ